MLDIEMRDITKRFAPARHGGDPILAAENVSLRIRRGEFFFLLGPSGCGKTTLLRILAGFEQPTAGRVLFNDVDVTHVPAERRRLAMVFQSYALWPHMTVAANVEFGPRMARRPRRARRATVDEMLGLVGMTERRHHKPAQLSGGQQQRVALARALAAGPRGLLFDEPLSNLDAQLRIRMRGEIRRLVNAAGTTAVYVTHDQEEALSMADRIAVMDQGRVVQVGAPPEVYHRPANRFVADFLGEANFLSGVVQELSGDQVRLDTPAGPILVTGSARVGKTITCCLRPENVRLDAPADGDANRLAGTYVTHTYLGATCRHEVRLADDQPFILTSLGIIDPPGPGSRVTVSFSPKDVALLE